MPRYESNEIRAERARVHEAMKSVIDAAEAESRDLTAEEAQEFDRMETRMGSLDADLRRVEAVEGFVPAEVGPNAEERDESRDLDAEYRAAFTAALRGDVEARAALSTTAANGGYTVPQTWADQIVESIKEESPIRTLADVLVTSNGDPINYPVVASAGISAAARAEADPYSEAEDTFSTVQLGAYDVGVLVKASRELVADSKFDIDAFVARRAAQAVGIKEGALFVGGSGSGEPQGVTKATVGKTTASNSAITADELVDMFHSVSPSYRTNAAWLLNDATVAVIRKLKTGLSGDNTYLWQPGLSAGQPDTLLGKPVYPDPHVEAITADAVVGVFGDFRRGFLIRDAGAVTVQILDQLYAANGQVGYIVNRRTDSKIVDANALHTLKMKA